METKNFKLWDGEVPGQVEGWETPSITYYPADEKKGDGCIVILAGGGYGSRSRHEDDGYARYLSDKGVDCFVVHYRVKPYTFPYPLLDARRGMRFVRANAEKFGINPNKIAIMGSSAGGHLAALLSTYRGRLECEDDGLDTVDYLPNGQILCYPVIEYQGHKGSFVNLLADKLDELVDSVTPSFIADEKTPPAFIWHTFEDTVVNVSNTFNYANKLKSLGVFTELHVYPYGPHGQGLAPNYPYLQNWADHLMSWLKLFGYIAE